MTRFERLTLHGIALILFGISTILRLHLLPYIGGKMTQFVTDSAVSSAVNIMNQVQEGAERIEGIASEK